MKKREIFLIFIICLIPRFIVSLKAFPMVYISDETSAVSIAAYFAGGNWNEVVSKAGYYGFGFLWLIAPLFKYIDSPVWIYRITLLILATVNALVGPICYALLSKFFGKINRNKKIIISSLCGCLTLLNTAVISVRNEEILNLIVWIVVYMLCAILSEDDKKKKIKYEVILLSTLGYSLTVHARSVTLYVGIIVAAILYYLFFKKKLIHTFFYIVMCAEYVVISKFVKIYQAGIWTTDVRNSSVSDVVTSSLSKISITKESMQGLFMICGGQLYTATLFTGGIFLIAIVIICLYALGERFYAIKQRDCYIVVIGGMFLFCAFLTIGGQSLTWLPGVYRGLIEETYKDAYRGFTYMRYMGVYIPPVVMCSLVVADSYYDILKQSVNICIGIFGILTLFWINIILPRIGNKLDIYFMTLSQTKAGMENTRDDWLKASIIIFIIMFGWLLFVYKKKINYQLLGIIIFLIVERIYIFENSTYINEQKIYEKADAGYNLLKEISTTIHTKDIYVFDASDSSDHQIFYIYQFMNNSFHIIPHLPEEISVETILFSNKNICDVLDEKAYWAQLDEDEYIYCFGENYKNIIEEAGVSLKYE